MRKSSTRSAATATASRRPRPRPQTSKPKPSKPKRGKFGGRKPNVWSVVTFQELDSWREEQGFTIASVCPDQVFGRLFRRRLQRLASIEIRPQDPPPSRTHRPGHHRPLVPGVSAKHRPNSGPKRSGVRPTLLLRRRPLLGPAFPNI